MKYSLTAQNALGKIKKRELVDGDGSVKVGYADKWLETRQDVSRMLYSNLMIYFSSSWSAERTCFRLLQFPRPSRNPYSGHFDSDPTSSSLTRILRGRPADPDNPSNLFPLSNSLVRIQSCYTLRFLFLKMNYTITEPRHSW